MEYKKALGKAIRTARRSKGLPQEKLGPSRVYVSDVERGIKEVSGVKINSFAEAIGVHPLTILTLSYLNANPELDLAKLQEVVKDEASEINKPISGPVFKKNKSLGK